MDFSTSFSFNAYQQGSQHTTSDFPGEQPLFADFGNGHTTDHSFANQDGLAHHPSSWNQASMQRYLNDIQSAPLCDPLRQQLLPFNTQPVESIPPVAFHHRHESPFSFQDLSSCSSSQSPGADTDLFTDNMPSTPPNMALFPSFQVPSYESFKPQSPFFPSGMGGFPGDAHSCKSMTEVTAVEDANEWKSALAVVDFGSPASTYAFENPAPVCHHHHHPTTAMSRQPSDEHDYKNVAPSPALSSAVKEEIVLLEHLPFPDNHMNGPYPTPSIRGSEGSDNEIDVASPASDEDEDDDDDNDDDYRPDTSTKRIQPSTRRTTRPERRAPAPLPKGAAPPNKRPKTGGAFSSSSSAPTQPAATRALPPSPISSASNEAFLCTDCAHAFKDAAALQAHVKKLHTRPFGCVFRFAGCGSTFASKNEWKRHVMSQHLVLHYWLCDIALCAQNRNSLAAAVAAGGGGGGAAAAAATSSPTTKTSRRAKAARRAIADYAALLALDPSGPPLPDGTIFNRKDLYTQHIRRMHTPRLAQKTAPSSSSSYYSSAAAKKTTHPTSPCPSTSAAAAAAEWEDEVKSLQTSALRERCQLPVYMQCPAPHCDMSFSGTEAWDQRMEHVARHLERAALGQEEPVVFGGPTDPSLMSWVTRADVAVVRAVGPEDWVLNNPLRAASEGRGVGRNRDVSLPSLSLGATVVPSLAGSSTDAYFPTESSPMTRNDLFDEEGDEDAEGEEE